MEHISEIELIEYAAGKLAERRIAEVREHMAECSQCSQHARQLEKLSNVIGKWEVETAEHGVADRVVALAKGAEHNQPAAARGRIVRFMPQVLRVAASIIIAIGLGHKLGEYSVEGRKPQTASSSEKPQYLAALGLEWSSGLAWLVLEEDPPETEGGQ